MEGNYSCSLCSQVAVQCCLCSTPRTYLCHDCVQPHTSSKRISHPLLPAATPAYVNKDNLAEHDRRVTALEKLVGQVEVASSRLAAERNALDQVFNEVYNLQMQRLYEVCSAVYSDISEYYERLQTEMDTLRRDLTATEQYVSEDVRKYIEASFHVPQPCTFLDAKEVMNRRIQITTAKKSSKLQNCLLEVVSNWKSSHCNCSDCCEIKTLLVCTQRRSRLMPGQGVSQAANPYWTCRGCKYEYNLSSACRKCGAKQQVANASGMLQASQIGIPSPSWVCPQCRYEYNMQSSCVKCQYQRAPPPAPTVPIMNPCWTCQRCGYAYNTTPTCDQCGSQEGNTQTAAPADQLPVSSRTKATTWTCVHCNGTNSAASLQCQHCNRLPGNSLPVTNSTPPTCRVCGWRCGGKCADQMAQRSGPVPFNPVLAQPSPDALSPYQIIQGINPAPFVSSGQVLYPKCRYCGNAYKTTRKCSKCLNQEDGDRWKCFGCGKLTVIAVESCTYCKAPRDLSLFLLSRSEMELTGTRYEWICKCGGMTPIYISKCNGCGKENRKVIKTLEYNGNNVGLGERLGKMFGL